MSIIGFIGVGELTLYTVKGLRRELPDLPVLLSPRNREKASLLQHDFGCEVMQDNQEVVDHADLIVIATRPDDCLEALSSLKFWPGQILISVVAGLEIEKLRSLVPAEIEIVRAMPVSSAEVGASPTLVYPRHDAVVELFDHCGKSIVVDNESFFTQGNILACVYSWFFELYQTLITATAGPALPTELSRELVMGMAAGAAQLALEFDHITPGEIADSIATKGTYSKLGLDLLRQQKAFDGWRDACKLLEGQLADND